MSLLATTILFCAKSRSPISILTGIPFTSASANLKPGDFSVSSIYATTPLFSNFSLYSSAIFFTSSLLPIGIITTCFGAIRGGKTKP